MPRGTSKKYLHLQDEWVKLYNEEGLNFTKIAKRYSVQPETVSRYINHLVSKKTRSPFKENVHKWLSDYRKGKSFAEIARSHNVSETAVKNNIYKELQPIIQDLKWTWIALYKKGQSLKQIGDVYNFHPKVILNEIKNEVHLNVKTNHNVYEHFRGEWAKLYREGLSFEAIANKYNVSTDTVYRNVRHKVQVRSKKTNSDLIQELVPIWRHLYYKKGYTLQQISSEYKISTSTIYRHVRETVSSC
ncbi:hypothetical protein [Halalkalibacter alkaliphilus]|uniref:Uncharacterized protein n=1 Tax=Halalkalibacter alkaliphilus TaxID=2917993 RepID=A0A9X2I704_9BACI|nr:hypothetical protein [Halalkalibacter alkaliphilus]MCL7748943.1 hypothetical protein [Halalkalibacter alkaliphilus]